MKTFRILLLFLTLSIIFSLSVSCSSSPPGDFSYRRERLAVRVEGNRGGHPLSCDIYCENGRWTSITYHAPDPWNGITVSAKEDGACTITGNGFSVTVPQDGYAWRGLTRPARILLLDGESEPRLQSVQRLSSQDLFTLSIPSEDAPFSLTLNTDGIPIFASGEDFSFRVSLLPSSSPPNS